MTFFCFDFSGSGNSEGEYISLGWYERQDLKLVIDYLRESKKVSSIGLWGRSMGAVTALLHVDRDPSIAGMVLDSPFSDLNKLSKELFRKYSKKMPSLFFTIAYKFVKGTVKKKAKFDLDKIKPIKHVDKCQIPSQFIAAKEDDFIGIHHSKELHQKYGGEKMYIECEGDHNSSRDEHTLAVASVFLYNVMQVQQLVPQYQATPERVKIAKSYPKFQNWTYHNYHPAPNLQQDGIHVCPLKDAVVQPAPYIKSEKISIQKDEEEKKGSHKKKEESVKKGSSYKKSKKFDIMQAIDQILEITQSQEIQKGDHKKKIDNKFLEWKDLLKQDERDQICQMIAYNEM